MKVVEQVWENFLISTDPRKLNVGAIHHFLCYHSSWSKGIPLDRVQKSIDQSLNFGVYDEDRQIGFARVISDYSTIAYLGDVYLLDEYRGKGLSKRMMDTILGHPELQGLRRWILLTNTAEWLYEKYGFVKVPHPEWYMEKFNSKVYERES
ncbi:GNAT family N-acetyltransferase [Leadbetterella byssophila]|uniref:GNAT family N-acetyltransferase n=1 Tax=Leadbetterella byssophila TaxID=316068 RepID=UPI0039A0D692